MSKNANAAAEAKDWIDRGAPAFEDAHEAKEFIDTVEQLDREQRRVAWLEAEVRADAGSASARALRHSARAAELAGIRRKVSSSAETAVYRAAHQIEGREGERLSDSDYAVFRKAVKAAVTDSELDEKLGRLQRRESRKAEKIRVTAEPGPYETRSPHSWVRDSIAASDADMRALLADHGTSDMSKAAVEARLQRHATDVVHSLRSRNRHGKQVERMLREKNRHEDPIVHEQRAREEFRALTTGGGATASASGGGAAAFVAPAVIMAAWAEFRSPYRAFADQLNTSVALPAYGLQAYVPSVTSGTTVTTEAELSGVSEGDPVAGFSASPIVLKAGQINVTQQFLDRAGPGIAGDVILFAQLHEQLDAQVDAYALTQALAGAQTVTNAGTFALASATPGVGGFLGDLKKGKSKLTDTAGTRLRGTHCFATSDFVDYIGAYSDGNARPVFAPELDANHLPIRAQGDQGAEGYSGYVLTGLALFADDNIPASGANTQIVVCRADTILQLEGAPIPYLYPPTYAGNLDAVLGVRSYVATIPRFPAGVSVISGAAYAAITFA